MKLIAFVLLAALTIVVPTANAQRQIINTPGVHPQGLPFSDAVLAGDTLYLSGNIGVDPKTGKIPDDFADEARQALRNLGAVLKAAGYDYKDVVKVNVYLADIARFNEWNKVYEDFFTGDFPARSTVGANGLSLEAKLEVEMIAVKRKEGQKKPAR